MSVSAIPIREAPASTVLSRPSDDPTRPNVPDEPELDVTKIQGNLLAGFNKDHQTQIFLKIRTEQEEAFRVWLGSLVPYVASTEEVLAFNRLFKVIRKRRGVETRTVMSTWINVALSFNALQRLAGNGKALAERAADFSEYSGASPDQFDVNKFTDQAFRAGMANRSVDVLSDPPDATAGKSASEGNRHNWVFGGPNNEADVVLIVASDSAAELSAEVARIEDTLYSGRPNTFGGGGADVIYKQHGNTLPPPLTGHEHFGYLDGVSQPGVRGRISSADDDVLTLRQNPETHQYPHQGKPGQDLLWPVKEGTEFPNRGWCKRGTCGPRLGQKWILSRQIRAGDCTCHWNGARPVRRGARWTMAEWRPHHSAPHR